MSWTDLLSSSHGVVAVVGGVTGVLAARWRARAAEHQAEAERHKATAADVSGRHQVQVAGLELTEEMLRSLLSRVRVLETAVANAEELRLQERRVCAERIATLEAAVSAAERRASVAESRADALATLVDGLRGELADLRRDSLAHVSPMRPSDRPEDT